MSGFKMIAIILAVTFVSANCFSIDTVSDNVKHVIKRDTHSDISVIFPDLRSRDLEEIGELKKKTVKRLALPVSYVLKSVAEPEGEDYYSQGGGESDDNYENKDWSDINRPPVDNARANINHTDLTDIEGIAHQINVMNQGDINNKQTKKKTHRNSEIVIIDDNEEKEDPQVTEPSQEQKKSTESSSKEEEDDYTDKTEKPEITERPKTASEEEEEKRVAEQTAKEKAEAEAKKQKILSEVDDLKARHEKEQRQIILSEKLKEDEIFKEEQERDRDRMHSSYNRDKYGHPALKHTKSIEYEDYPELDSVEDKYKIHPISKSTSTSTTTKGTKPPTRRKPKKEKVIQQNTGKLSVFKNPRAYMIYDDYEESLEQSSSRSSSTTERIVTEPHKAATKYSAKYTAKNTKTTPIVEEHERISLVPEDDETKAGEPTLFFPMKRKNKHKKKMEYSSSAHDSIVAETFTDPLMNDSVKFIDSAEIVSDKLTSNKSTTPTGVSAEIETAITSTAPDTLVTAADTAITVADSSVTAADSSVTAADSSVTAADSSVTAAEASSPVSDTSSPFAVTSPSGSAEDTVAVSAHAHKKVEKPQDFNHEHGGHKSHKAEHHTSHGEEGKKAYKEDHSLLHERGDVISARWRNGWPKPWYYAYGDGVGVLGYHADTKAEKGNHDKEAHSGEYHDAAGYNKHHEKASDHYGAHEHEEHGKKQAKYEESGKHSKGHSTKGSHDIHKKEEYEKKVEFFEEEGDSAESEKKGGHHSEKKHGKGGYFKRNNLAAAHHHQDKGDGAKFEKGSHHLLDKGHKQAGGYDSHGKRGTFQAHSGGKESGKKWVYHHGYPAKTANLVIIDRRGDKYTHGPQYFG